MDGGDPLDELGRELRERVGHEMRQEAEMVEQFAAAVEDRRRTMADLATELLSRGDIVTVIAGERSLRGRLNYARGHIASLETAAGGVDVHLTAGVALRIDERSTSGGSGSRAGSDTLRARLLEHEMAGSDIEVWAPDHGIGVSGSIAAVGKDHVIVRERTDTEWVLQLAQIAWVRRV